MGHICISINMPGSTRSSQSSGKIVTADCSMGVSVGAGGGVGACGIGG